MGKKNPDTAVIAAIAAALTTFTVARVDIPHDPPSEHAAAVAVQLVQPIKTVQPVPEAPAETLPPVTLYDVPLSAALQLHIIQVAGFYHIDPAIIFAICYRESTYNPASIGDNGRSFGLMQIQPKWHSERMARLGCTDLLDPFQNVTVGIDYLAEQVDRYGGDISKALVAYNAGHYNGTITSYAVAVLAEADELRGVTYEEGR